MAAQSLLGAVFLVSGASGLLYEIVWLRMLVRVFGVTQDAVSTILTAYMAGLALGALVAGRRATSSDRPLAAYAALEAGIAVAAAVATAMIGALPALLAGAGSPLVRAAASLAVLLPPTTLMGMTLPYLVRAATTHAGELGHRTSFLYGMNTLGAAAGVAWSGFISLGAWGETATVATGVALNLAIATVAFLAARRTPSAARLEAAPSAAPGWSGPTPLLLAAAAGFIGLAAESLWSRILTLFVGNSVYAFSAVLTVFLVFTALGSLGVRRHLDSLSDPAGACAEAFAALAAWLLIGLYGVRLLGAFTSDPRYLYSPITRAADLAPLAFYALPVVAPATLILGALFPLLVRLSVADLAGLTSGLGRLYAANTAGAIAGAIAAGFALIPLAGTRGSVLVLALIAAIAGHAVATWHRPSPTHLRRARLWAGLAALSAAGLLALPDPFLSVMLARLDHYEAGTVAYHREERAGTVTAYMFEPKRGALLINGLFVSGTGGAGRSIFHLPFLFRDRPGSAFVVGLGCGEAAGCALRNGVPVEVAELNPAVPAAYPIFHPDTPDLVATGKIRVTLADGRNRLLRMNDNPGIIIVDGSPPIFASGVVNLYSREFFTLAAERLTPDGVMMLWVPLPCFPSDFWMIARGFLDAFPHAAALAYKGHAGIVLAGSREPLDLDPARVQARIDARGLARHDPGLTARLVTGGLVMTTARLRELALRYPPVTDDRPRTEFPLPRFLAGEPFVDDPKFLVEAR